jgi:altronate dehydratase
MAAPAAGAGSKPAKKHVTLGYEAEDGSAATAAAAAAAPPAPAGAGVPRAAPDAPPVPFGEVAVLPEAGDNCAIARTVIPGGTRIVLPPDLAGGATVVLDHTALEGHRFAVADVAVGTRLLSWGLTFGEATRPMAPGNYLANDRVLAALRGRHITDLPATANFADLIVAHTIDEATFAPADQVPAVPAGEVAAFQGFPRPGGRGIGTRNYIILIGTTSLTAAYVKALEARVKEAGAAAGFPNVDGVVAVAHTEGGGDDRPHNFDLLCTTLTAFMIHANVAAALVVDYGAEAVTCADLAAHAARAGLPLADVPHRFLTLSGALEADLATGMEVVTGWLPAANAAARVPCPASALSIAQQCGGSDAFSGVSGNPCAGEACKILIAHGGQAVLAETDELMGAEAYILRRVKDLPTARKFLGIIDAFKARLAWHGQSAESNPSGGNNYRGLYNIGLKSLGAAKKKHADVRLDGVLAYGERTVAMDRGYYMMDSPGNDLESIAGQVATGCNLIYFITGNGSITNFPFVPTIKIVTTSARFALLRKDMDFNAGRYQEGTPMPALGAELFDLTLRVASGEKSVGERAGHAQVSIWRNWPQAGPNDAIGKLNHGTLPGKALRFKPGTAALAAPTFPGYVVPGAGVAVERIGLVLPTSLCSGEVARQIVAKLNGAIAGAPGGDALGSALVRHVTRFECLPHTEGCGTGYPDGGIALYERVQVGHLTHPAVRMALCLEHGCEKTHNDFMHGALEGLHLDPGQFGYASIQLDGGIESVTGKVVSYFARRAADEAPEARAPVSVGALVVGLLIVPDKAAAGAGASRGGATAVPPAPVPVELAEVAAAVAQAVVAAGGAVVLPSTSTLFGTAAFGDALDVCGTPAPTIAFGQAIRAATGVDTSGIHVMDMPMVTDWTETVTGLAATGAHVILALSTPPRRGAAKVVNGHPMIPVVHVGLCTDGAVDPAYAAAADAVLTPPAPGAARDACVAAWGAGALSVVADVAGGGRKPKASATPFFQITRGAVGVST